jgi:hypothetical protein
VEYTNAAARRAAELRAQARAASSRLAELRRLMAGKTGKREDESGAPDAGMPNAK